MEFEKFMEFQRELAEAQLSVIEKYKTGRVKSSTSKKRRSSRLPSIRETLLSVLDNSDRPLRVSEIIARMKEVFGSQRKHSSMLTQIKHCFMDGEISRVATGVYTLPSKLNGYTEMPYQRPAPGRRTVLPYPIKDMAQHVIDQSGKPMTAPMILEEIEKEFRIKLKGASLTPRLCEAVTVGAISKIAHGLYAPAGYPKRDINSRPSQKEFYQCEILPYEPQWNNQTKNRGTGQPRPQQTVSECSFADRFVL